MGLYVLLVRSRHLLADVKFLLLHDQRIDEGATRAFFIDAYELYLKVILNPFHEPNSPIAQPLFEERVKGLAKRYFPSRGAA